MYQSHPLSIELAGLASRQSPIVFLVYFGSQAWHHSIFVLSSFLCCMYSPFVFLFLMRGAYVYSSIIQTTVGYFHRSFVSWSRSSCAVMTAHILLDHPLHCNLSLSRAAVDRTRFDWSGWGNHVDSRRWVSFRRLEK